MSEREKERKKIKSERERERENKNKSYINVVYKHPCDSDLFGLPSSPATANGLHLRIECVIDVTNYYSTSILQI